MNAAKPISQRPNATTTLPAIQNMASSDDGPGSGNGINHEGDGEPQPPARPLMIRGPCGRGNAAPSGRSR